MGRRSILPPLVSGLLGLALADLAPQRWAITPVHGLLLGLAARAAIFLALWWTQAVLCFDVMPDADVRRGFITLSAWVVAQALLGGSSRKEGLVARI